MNPQTYASAYEYRAMVKTGPGFEIYPGKWEKFWARIARWLLLTG